MSQAWPHRIAVYTTRGTQKSFKKTKEKNQRKAFVNAYCEIVVKQMNFEVHNINVFTWQWCQKQIVIILKIQSDEATTLAHYQVTKYLSVRLLGLVSYPFRRNFKILYPPSDLNYFWIKRCVHINSVIACLGMLSIDWATYLWVLDSDNRRLGSITYFRNVRIPKPSSLSKCIFTFTFSSSLLNYFDLELQIVCENFFMILLSTCCLVYFWRLAISSSEFTRMLFKPLA